MENAIPFRDMRVEAITHDTWADDRTINLEENYFNMGMFPRIRQMTLLNETNTEGSAMVTVEGVYASNTLNAWKAKVYLLSIETV